MIAKPTVFIVDDDDAMRDSLVWLLESNHFLVRSFISAEHFLGEYKPEEPGCLVLDVRMPGMSGLELHEKLNAQGYQIPVIFITGHGDVPMAVAAVKKGAINFIEKPFNENDILAMIRQALDIDMRNREKMAQQADASAGLASLTPREKEVMERVVAGKLNKTIADELDISIKTVEAHRAKVMEKTGANSVADLVRLRLSTR